LSGFENFREPVITTLLPGVKEAGRLRSASQAEGSVAGGEDVAAVAEGLVKPAGIANDPRPEVGRERLPILLVPGV
jgi:hypothetical protein